MADSRGRRTTTAAESRDIAASSDLKVAQQMWMTGADRRGSVSLPPRLALRRFYLLTALAAVALLLTAAVGWAVWWHIRSGREWREAVERLKEDVPAFAGYTFRPIKPATTERASEMIDASGASRGIVLFRANSAAYITFIMPGLRYKPCSDARTQELVEGGLPTDPRRLRMVKHALGAALLLWPDLEPGSASIDKIEAVSLTARNATARIGVRYKGRHLGVALEIDLFHYRLLAAEVQRL